MAATLEILDLFATDLAHPRPRPRFGTPVPPPPRSERWIAPAQLDAPVWPGAETAPPVRIHVEAAPEAPHVETPWIRVEAPLALDAVPEIDLDPDDDAPVPVAEPDDDDIAPECLEAVAPDESVAPDEPVARSEAFVSEAAFDLQEAFASEEAFAPEVAAAVVPEVAAPEVATPEVATPEVQAAAVDDFGGFESEWFAEEPVFTEGPRRVGWLDLVLPISAGLGAAALFGTTLALFGTWS